MGVLNLSEDAVKQRLSRGRQMMKREIEAMVEQTLFETRPQEASVRTLPRTPQGTEYPLALDVSLAVVRLEVVALLPTCLGFGQVSVRTGSSKQ